MCPYSFVFVLNLKMQNSGSLKNMCHENSCQACRKHRPRFISAVWNNDKEKPTPASNWYFIISKRSIKNILFLNFVVMDDLGK